MQKKGWRFQKKQSCWPHSRHNGHFWSYYGQMWPNIGLITILGEYNFTSQFLCKKMVEIPEKAVLLTPFKTQWPFWPYYGQIWPNIGLITILGEYNFTSQFLCEKRVEIPEKAYYGHYLAMLWPNLATYRFIFLLDPDTSPQALRINVVFCSWCSCWCWCCCYQIFNSLRIYCCSTDRYETFHTY